MESAGCEKAYGPFVALEVDSGKESSGYEGNCNGFPISSEDNEWHSISLEDPSSPDMDYCFQIIERKHIGHRSREIFSMCGLSKCLGVERNGDDETESLVEYPRAFRKECSLVSIEAPNDQDGMREVRVSFHGLEDSKTPSNVSSCQKVGKAVNKFGDRDDGCLPLFHQLRAFIREVKLSFSGLLYGDSKGLAVQALYSLLDKSISFKSSPMTSPAAVKPCKMSNGSSLITSASTASLTLKLPSRGLTDTMKPNALRATDPQSRAEALPLAHYRPTDGGTVKDGESKAGQSSTAIAGSKSPGSCKKPPKPPKYPGKSASSNTSATPAAHRSVRKLKDRVSAKRKSRAGTAAVGSGVTPLIALVLTLGFGLFMVCQGVFVQPNGSYDGKNVDKSFADTSSNVEPFPSEANSASHGFPNPIDAHSLSSINLDAMKNEEAISEAFHNSMKDLPWSRNSLTSHVKADSG